MNVRRLHATACALLVLGAAGPAAPALAKARSSTSVILAPQIRVTPNLPLRPDGNPLFGRDGVGVAINPRNSRHRVAIYADWTTLWCEVASTRNGGRTWRRARLKAPAGFIWPPCTVGGHLSSLIDGGIGFGKGKTVYASFASAVVNEQGDTHGKSVLVARSRDGGRTFSTGVVALRGGTVPSEGPDYVMPKITVVPKGGTSGRDRIYLIAGSTEQDHSGQRGENTMLSISDDGGQTWSVARQINGQDESAIEQSQLAVGRGGDLFVAWRQRGRGAQPNQFTPEGLMVVARSTDRGRTWTRTATATVRGYVHEGSRSGPFTTTTSYTASTFPRLAADRKSGNVYVVYGNGERPGRPGAARAADHFIHPDMDVWLQRSTDGGRTWKDAKQLNRPADVQTEITQTRHPNVSVAPNGRVDVAWHDRRHWYRGCTHTHLPCDEARLGDTYWTYSYNGGRSFAPERRITDRSMNNDVGFDYRFGAYWDYGPVIANLGENRIMITWMDSRDGNVETDSMGLYFSEVRLTAMKPNPALSVRYKTSEELAIGMSRFTYPGGAEALLAGTFATRPASQVVIVNRRDAAGALAGGVLARANLGPVLISGADGLSPAVEAELTRLAPVGAYVIGGESSLSQGVVDDLVATGIPAAGIKRIWAPDLAGTARSIAAAMDRRTAREKRDGKPAFDAVVVVNPATVEGSTAAALAVNRRLPVLFVDEDAVPQATKDALAELDIRKALVVGGRASVSDAVASQLPGAQRLGGSSTLATSRAVLTEARRRGLPENVVFTMRGNALRVALAGAAVGRTGGQLLVARGVRQADRALRRKRLAERVDHLLAIEVRR